MKTTVGNADPGDGSRRAAAAAPLGPPRTLVLRWLTNPWFSGLAAVASIISVPLAVYLFATGARGRALAFYVNPIKTAVVQAGTTSALRVLYRDQPVNTSVTAVQVAVWNDGKEPIRAEHVLSEVLIRVASPILEASVKKTTRAVTAFSLADSQMQYGIVGLKWRILEGGDGAIIQLIYAGSPDCRIGVEGVVEGQRDIAVVTPRPRTRKDPLPFTRAGALALICSVFILGMLVAAAFVINNRRFSRRLADLQPEDVGIAGLYDTTDRYLNVALFLVPLALSVALVFLLWGSIANPSPPFGF